MASDADAAVALTSLENVFMDAQQRHYGDDRSRWTRLCVIAAVSCLPPKPRALFRASTIFTDDVSADNAASQLQSQSQHLSQTLTGGSVQVLLQQLVTSAAMHLSGFVDAAVPSRWHAALAAVQTAASGAATSASPFGDGVWMVPWSSFVDVACSELGLLDAADAAAFSRHCHKIGVVVCCAAADTSTFKLARADGSESETAGAIGASYSDAAVSTPRTVVAVPSTPCVRRRMFLPDTVVFTVAVARLLLSTGESCAVSHCVWMCV